MSDLELKQQSNPLKGDDGRPQGATQPNHTAPVPTIARTRTGIVT